MNPGRRVGGFTLIELLAVVLIVGLAAGLVLPNLGVVSSRALEDGARQLAAELELARQRAVMTGTPHRMLLDLDGGTWWLEAEVPQDPPAPTQASEGDAAGAPPRIDLSPPPSAQLAFQPLPSGLGRPTELDPNLYFSGVETTEGWIEGGQVPVTFASDGTADPTAIGLATEAGEELFLDVLPLADAVRWRDASS